MRSNNLKFKLIYIFIVLNLSNVFGQQIIHQTASLKSTFKKDFLIGAALNAAQIEEKDLKYAVLIPQQFISWTYKQHVIT
jgi:hypothetical protein